MTHDSGSGALTHYKKLSFRAWIEENKVAFVFFTALFVVGMIAGALVPLVAFVSKGFATHLLFNPFFAFTGGFLLSLGLMFGARAIDRKFFGAVKAGILAVEDRIIGGSSPTQMADLQKLVDGYLKLKRIEAADFYSKKLLEWSKSGGTAVLNMSDWIVTSDCWVSTEPYNKSWKYYTVWLFETRGILTLSNKMLDFKSKKFNFSCNPSHVISIEKKRHPLWMKPIPLYYIKLVIDECGEKHTFCITPSFGHTDTIFDANRMVEVWLKRLTNFRHSLSPSSQVPDWVQELQVKG